MSETTPSLATPQGGIFSISGRHWLILLMVQLANLLFGMTITLANVVLPQIRGALSATQDEISWVITLNLVATAVATPMTHWLASRLGWRTMMFCTVLGFTVASFMCATATSLESLIFYRVCQGLFGGGVAKSFGIDDGVVVVKDFEYPVKAALRFERERQQIAD